MVNGEACQVNDATEFAVNSVSVAPAGAKVSQAAIGRALGMSPANITKLKKQGMPVDSVESAQAWRMARQNVAARKPVPGQHNKAALPPLPAVESTATDLDDIPMGEGHDEARTRLRISEANLSEMREAEERGQLIRVDAVKAALSVAMATARESLLQIPSRLAALLAANSDPASVQNLLHSEIHQALVELSGTSARLGEAPQGFE